MKIRKAEIEDALELQILSKQLGYEAEESLIKNNLKSMQKKKFSKILVACLDKKIVGYVSFEKYETLYSEPGINISGLVVLHEYRGKGVGSALLRATEQYAIDNSFSFIRANSGIEREGAHIFYRKNMFCSEKLQKKFIKNIKHK